MSTSVASLSTNFFPSAENGFTTTTSGSVASAATTVGLNSVAGYTNGEVVVFVIDPTDATKKQTFTGVIDTSGSQVTSVVWTAGTNQTHALGATVVDYATATHISMMTKGITQSLNQDGSLISQAVLDALNLGAGASDGWTPFGYSLTSITALGNRSYTAVVSGTDTTGVTSVGQRLKLPRTVTAPTGSITLNGTTQYANKTSPAGMTFTDDFTVSAWVKMTSYAAAGIASRFNGTSGWSLQTNSSGQLSLIGYNASGGNSSLVTAYQSLPLNKWVHVAAQLDMSTFTATTTTSYVMIDGVNVPASVSRTGTNPTALVQAGNLEVGSVNAGGFFPGQIAQVAIYSAKVTQATILASMNQTLTGSETSLVSAYKLDQASGLNDLSANANNLTAQGSPSYSTTQTPFTNSVTGTSVTAGTTNYGIIMAQTFSTNTTYTIQIPEGETLPTTGGIGTVSYSTQKTPYGFPVYNEKLVAEVLLVANSTVTSTGAATDIPGLTHTFTVPTTRAYKITAYFSNIFMATGAPPAITLNLTDGSNNILTGLQLQSGGANYQNTTTLNSESMVLAAGSTTLKMRGTAASTFSLNSAAGNKTYLRIEEA